MCGLVVGNKLDLASTTGLLQPSLSRLSDLYCLEYALVSAKEDRNIAAAFDRLCELMLDQRYDVDDVDPSPDSMPSFALHSFQPHSPVEGSQPEEGVGCVYCY